MNVVSAFGIRVRLVASVTFPAGVTLSQFADDADPLDFPSQTIGGTAMGVNGDMVFWSTPSPSAVTLNTIPGSEDDRNLAALFDANKVSKGRFGSKDVITLTVLYPDGTNRTLSQGKMIGGPPARGVAGTGRIKTSAYVFNFES